jgi:hypothetical protein
MIRVVTDRNKQTEMLRQKPVHQRSRIILTHCCDHQQQLGLLTRVAGPHSVIAFPSPFATAQWKLIGRSLLCMINSDHFCLLATCISTACWSVCAISSALQQSSHYKSQQIVLIGSLVRDPLISCITTKPNWTYAVSWDHQSNRHFYVVLPFLSNQLDEK